MVNDEKTTARNNLSICFGLSDQMFTGLCVPWKGQLSNALFFQTAFCGSCAAFDFDHFLLCEFLDFHFDLDVNG